MCPDFHTTRPGSSGIVRMGPVWVHSAIMPFALTSGQWLLAYFGVVSNWPFVQKNDFIIPTQSAHHLPAAMSFMYPAVLLSV